MPSTKPLRQGTTKLAVGLSLLSLIVATAIFAPMFLAEHANRLTSNIGLGWSPAHPLGTNDFGQDTFARTLVAARLTLVMSISAAAIAVLGGLAVGLGIWSLTGRLRELALRVLETAVAYPTLVLALIIAAILKPGVTTTILAIGIAGIPAYARVTVNLARSVSKTDYVSSARLLGVPPLRLAIRHLLPNIAEPLFVFATTIFAVVLVEISALSFIGLGVQSPDYDFGRLLNESLPSLYTRPIQAAGPSLMIVLSGIAMLLIGDALAVRSNPRLRSAPVRTTRVHQAATVVLTPGDEAVVRVKNLHIAVGNPGAAGKELVQGISLHVNRGETVALVGESGSGKSLTAMAIAGLAAPELAISADELRVDTMNMLGTPERSRLAREISVIYQDPGSTFNPALRMGAQLTEVLRMHVGFSKSKAFEAMKKALTNIGISSAEERMRQHPYQWSGGMRQRAMIASGMVNDPRLIIADEPTTALDVTVQLEVLRQLREVHEKHETSTLFISHDLGVVGELCDRIYVMRLGSIVEELSAEQLRSGDVHHEYTKALLAAVPALDLGDQS